MWFGSMSAAKNVTVNTATVIVKYKFNTGPNQPATFSSVDAMFVCRNYSAAEVSQGAYLPVTRNGNHTHVGNDG